MYGILPLKSCGNYVNLVGKWLGMKIGKVGKWLGIC